MILPLHRSLSALTLSRRTVAVAVPVGGIIGIGGEFIQGINGNPITPIQGNPPAESPRLRGIGGELITDINDNEISP